MKSLLTKLKLLNAEGQVDRSTWQFYLLNVVATCIAAYTLYTQSLSVEAAGLVAGLYTLAAGFHQTDKLQTIRAGDSEEEKAALVAKVEAAAADAAGAKAQAAQTAFEAVQLKDKLTQVDNRTKGRG